jgi:hypothetical protein
MNKMAWERLLAAVLLASLLAFGCGGPNADRPATYPVTGTVTLNGEAVEGATVAFQPAAGGQGAVGTTDASGNYSLTTFSSGDGALPGEYQVKIFKYKGEESGAVADQESDDYVPPMLAGEQDTGGPENLLPDVYANPATSELKATVTEDGDNTFDFPLEG